MKDDDRETYILMSAPAYAVYKSWGFFRIVLTVIACILIPLFAIGIITKLVAMLPIPAYMQALIILGLFLIGIYWVMKKYIIPTIKKAYRKISK